MTKQPYRLLPLLLSLQQKPHLKTVLLALDALLPEGMMVLFYGSLAFLVLTFDLRVLPAAFFPAATLALVKTMRKHSSKPRPFEVYDFVPLRPHSGGHSFPSCHASSSFVIAVELFYLCRPLGLLAFGLSAIIAVTRVLTGVHFPKDVLAGSAIGLFVGFMGYFVLLPLCPFGWV